MRSIRRVLFIQTQGENAGAQEVSRLVAAGLAARGYDVAHLFFYRKSAHFDAPPHTSYCCPARPQNPVAALRFLWSLGRRIRDARPDVILTFQHYGNTVGGVIAGLVSPAPIIANQVSPREAMNWLLRATDLAMGTLGFFKSITVNSAGMLEGYLRNPARYSARLVHIPHGFDYKGSGLSQLQARASFGLPAGVRLLGSVARLHAIKRVDAAIRILAHRPDWHLAVAGQGEEEASLRQLASGLNLTGRVHFVGEMSPQRIGDFLATLDVFVFPTRAETFGLAAVEAAGAGIPVVATDLPVLREVLNCDGQPAALFVDSSSDAALADAVAAVLDDERVRESLVEAGHGLRRRYSVDAMVDAYETIIKNLTVSDRPLAMSHAH